MRTWRLSPKTLCSSSTTSDRAWPNEGGSIEGEADRLPRAAANGADRGRLQSDASLRPTHPPRALILSTGEERPSGESLIARMFLVEIAPGDIDPQRLTARQRDAAWGLCAQAAARYIAGLAPRLGEVRADIKGAHVRDRAP